MEPRAARCRRGRAALGARLRADRDDPDAADAAYNAASVAELRDAPWEAVLARLRAAREEHDEAVRGLRALEPERYAEGRTPHRLATAGNHDREHIEPIREWRRE